MARVFDPIIVAEIHEHFADEWRERPDAFSPAFAGFFKAPVPGGLELVAATRALAAYQRAVRQVFEGIDVIVTPTVPITAPAIDGPIDGALILRNTWPFNAARTPALSVPCPGGDPAALPVGVQIAASKEATVLVSPRSWNPHDAHVPLAVLPRGVPRPHRHLPGAHRGIGAAVEPRPPADARPRRLRARGGGARGRGVAASCHRPHPRRRPRRHGAARRLAGAASLSWSALDESGFVVSAITDDGYLRVHRHATAWSGALGAQFFVGQPIEIATATGTLVPGVFATPSTHLGGASPPRSGRDRAVWTTCAIDLGARSRDDVAALGVRVLDAVSLRERATVLAGGTRARRRGRHAARGGAGAHRGRAAGRRPAARARAASRSPGSASRSTGSVALVRVATEAEADRLILLRGALAPNDDQRGAVGTPGLGPIIADDDTALADAARQAGVAVQTLPAERVRAGLPQQPLAARTHVIALPALFAHTPVEDDRGRGRRRRRAAAHRAHRAAERRGPGGDPAHAARPRAAGPDRRRGPGGPRRADCHAGRFRPRDGGTHRDPEAPAGVGAGDGRGRPQGQPLRPDGRAGRHGHQLAAAAVRRPHGRGRLRDHRAFATTARRRCAAAAGCTCRSTRRSRCWSQTPKGPVPAVMAPRPRYAAATAAQPAIEISCSTSARQGGGGDAGARRRGVAAGHHPQAPAAAGRPRATGPGDGRPRRVDGRCCSRSSRSIRSTLTREVTFAWVVEEETGLAGAQAMVDALERALRRLRHRHVRRRRTRRSTTSVVGQAPLGGGAVLRGLDSRTLVRAPVVDRILRVTSEAGVALQVGVTSGGTDASAFYQAGAIDVGLSWPGRYSHSPVEVMDRGDLDALVKAIVALAKGY